MVTKITVGFPDNFSMTKEKSYLANQTFQAAKNVADIAKHLEKISRCISYIDQFPDISAEQAIMHIFGNEGVTIHCKHYTKKRRVYSIWLLYIHEEDLSPVDQPQTEKK